MASKKNEKKTVGSVKAVKHKKAPGIFKKAVKTKKWEKKFLKKLYLPEDIKFLKSLAVEENGLVTVDVSALSVKDYKRLKMLGKAIKKNRKGFNFIIILIIAVLVGGAVFFQLYLKNKLVQNLVETQLEKIFLAEVDAEGVNLSILGGELSLDYLSIADAANPMKNLIEFSSIKADFKISEILQGRVFIEELGFSGLKRGSARAVSGALASGLQPDLSGNSPESSATEPEGKDIIGDVVTQISALAGDIDVKDLLEQQKENLQSFGIIDDSKERVDGYVRHWENRSVEWSNKIEDWDSSIKYISTVDAASFDSIEAAKTTIDKLQNIYSDAEGDYAELAKDYSSAEQQYADASNMVNEIRSAVDADYKYIESLVTLPAGDKVDWAASIIEAQFSVPLKKYLSYLERGLEWYGRFEKLSEIREERSPDKRRSGRSLPEPAGAPPSFVLVHAFASGEEPEVKYQFDLNNLVSEPEKWSEGASLNIGVDTASTGPAEVTITEENLNLSVPAAPFDLGDSLKALDLESFSGLLAVDSDVAWSADNFDGSIDISTDELVLNPAKDDSILYRLINTAIESVKPVSAEGNFLWSDSEGLDLKLDTNLDNGLGDAASALIAEGSEEGLKLLQDYLGGQLENPMKEFESARSKFGDQVENIKAYQTEIDSYKSLADDKIAEIRKSVEDNILKEAETLIKNVVPDDAVDTIKKGLGGLLNF